MDFKKQNGQAITELVLSMILFAMVLFGLDFMAGLVLAKNRAEIYQHHLLFKNYRKSEDIKAEEAPHPDPENLKLKTKEEHFSGRAWLNLKYPKSYLIISYIPRFEKQAKHFLGLESIPHASYAKILRDPWNEHPIRYVLWGIAIAIATAKNYSGDSGGASNMFSSNFENMINNAPISNDFGNIGDLFGSDSSFSGGFNDFMPSGESSSELYSFPESDFLGGSL